MDCDFTKGKCKGLTSLNTTITYDSNGATFSISKNGDSPTLHSGNYIFFGHVEIELQAAEGKGIITSLVLLSDSLDEVVFDAVGADNKQIQSLYVSKGDYTYSRGGFHNISNPLTSTHKYAFDWTAEKVEWFIDGISIRTLKASDVSDKFPQSPMQVIIRAWVAGYDGNPPGTIEWSGGIADFSNGPATAIFKSVKVTDYAGGSSPTDKKVKEYVYGDRTGSASSIQINLDDGSPGSSSSSSKSGTSTATSSASSTAMATATSTPASQGSCNGVVIGGAVGGALGALLLGMLGYLAWRHFRKDQATAGLENLNGDAHGGLRNETHRDNEQSKTLAELPSTQSLYEAP